MNHIHVPRGLCRGRLECILIFYISVCRSQYALVVKINILVNSGWDAGG